MERKLDMLITFFCSVMFTTNITLYITGYSVSPNLSIAWFAALTCSWRVLTK